MCGGEVLEGKRANKRGNFSVELQVAAGEGHGEKVCQASLAAARRQEEWRARWPATDQLQLHFFRLQGRAEDRVKSLVDRADRGGRA